MNLSLLVFIGAGLGGVTRFWAARTIQTMVKTPFPYGTLFVNALGSFLIGFLFLLLLERFGRAGLSLRAFLLVGFLGGFTTFSSFSLETFNLFESGQSLWACWNIILNVCLCLLLTWLGILGARLL